MNLANFSGADLRAFAANSTFVPRPVSCPEKARCAMFEWASLEPRCGTPDSALAEISTLRAHAAENNNGRVGAQSRLAAAQRAPQMNKPAPCSNAALCGHWPLLSTLRCSFPKADIGEGAQQSDTPEVRSADCPSSGILGQTAA